MLYKSENPKWPLKTSLLLLDSSFKFATMDTCVISSPIHNIVHYLQLNGARVLDFNPDYSILQGCCQHGDIGYVEHNDTTVSIFVNKKLMTFDETKMYVITRYSEGYKIVMGITRIGAEVSTCADIRRLTQEINYSDTISFLCKITSIDLLTEMEKKKFDGVLKNLVLDCRR